MIMSKRSLRKSTFWGEKRQFFALTLLSALLFSSSVLAASNLDDFVVSAHKIQAAFNEQIQELNKKVADPTYTIANWPLKVQNELLNVKSFHLGNSDESVTLLKTIERLKSRIDYTAKHLSGLTEQVKAQTAETKPEQINQIQKSLPEQIYFLSEELLSLEALQNDQKLNSSSSSKISPWMFYTLGVFCLFLLTALTLVLRTLRQSRQENTSYLQRLRLQDHSLQTSLKQLKKLKATSEHSLAELSHLDHQLHDLKAHENLDEVRNLLETSEHVEDLLQTQRSLIYRAVATASADSENLAIITDLVQFVEEISSKTKVIHDIAFKTKVLSFNASVEAERAGARGRGFSVVAQEMKRLAEISGKAAEDIGAIVERTRRSTQVLASSNPTEERTAHISLLEAEANVEKLQQRVTELKGQLNGILQQRDLTQQNFDQVTSLIKQINAAQGKMKELNEDIIQQQMEQQNNLAA